MTRLQEMKLIAEGSERDRLELQKQLDVQRLRADTAEAERDAMRTSKEAVEFNLNKVDRALLAAEQRIAELSANNQQLRKLLGQTLAALNPTKALSKSIRAALNHNPEAESNDRNN